MYPIVFEQICKIRVRGEIVTKIIFVEIYTRAALTLFSYP